MVKCRSVADNECFLKQVLRNLPGVSAVNSSFAPKTMTTALPV